MLNSVSAHEKETNIQTQTRIEFEPVTLFEFEMKYLFELEIINVFDPGCTYVNNLNPNTNNNNRNDHDGNCHNHTDNNNNDDDDYCSSLFVKIGKIVESLNEENINRSAEFISINKLHTIFRTTIS